MKLVTVYDIKGAYYHPIQCYKTLNDALRSFKLSCESSQTVFSQFPEDFILLEIADFNEITGVVTSQEKRTIASASEFATTKQTLTAIPTNLVTSELEARN